MTDKLTEEIYAMFANTKMEATQSYVGRGRSFESETIDGLKSRWIEQLAAMADNTTEFNRLLMDDLEAELGLRGLDVPADEAPELVKKLAARSKAETESWSAKRLEAEERRIQRQLDKIRPSERDKN